MEKQYIEILKNVAQDTYQKAILTIESDEDLKNCKSFEELHDFCDANFLLFNLDDFKELENSYFLRACNILIEYLDLYLKTKNDFSRTFLKRLEEGVL